MRPPGQRLFLRMPFREERAAGLQALLVAPEVGAGDRLGHVHFHAEHLLGERGGFEQGESFWFLTDSRYFKDPCVLYQWLFREITLVGTIEIERCGKPAKNCFVYTCKDLRSVPTVSLPPETK